MSANLLNVDLRSATHELMVRRRRSSHDNVRHRGRGVRPRRGRSVHRGRRLVHGSADASVVVGGIDVVRHGIAGVDADVGELVELLVSFFDLSLRVPLFLLPSSRSNRQTGWEKANNQGRVSNRVLQDPDTRETVARTMGGHQGQVTYGTSTACRQHCA